MLNPLRPCPNCGDIGSHFAPPSFGQKGFYLCDAIKDHVRIPITVNADNGQAVHGHITGDPDMSPELRKALTEMMRIAANQAMSEADLNSGNSKDSQS